MNPIKIAHDRQLFWDDHLVNTSLTSAGLRQHQPRREEITLEFRMSDSDVYSMIFAE